MSASDAVEELLDRGSDERVRDVDSSDDLERATQCSAVTEVNAIRRSESTHLRDDLEPDVDADARSALGDGAVHGLVVAVFEPKGEKTKRVLKRVALGERDGTEKSWRASEATSDTEAQRDDGRITAHH